MGGSLSGQREWQAEGLVFFLDFARGAELVWLVGFVVLLIQLLRHSSQHKESVCAETVYLLTAVQTLKWVLPSVWRFHEAGFLDKFTAIAALVLYHRSCCVPLTACVC